MSPHTTTTNPSIHGVASLELNNGTKMPVVGMGCWIGEPGGAEIVKEMCKNALEVGYRHFDTAAGYMNEKAVGEAIRESGIPREEIYVTTKLWNGHHHRVAEAFEESLKELDIGYIDLYLMHWPQAIIDDKVLPPGESPTVIETYIAMQNLLKSHPNSIKSIGVSNFSVSRLSELLASPKVTIPPVVNQIQMHPHLPQTDVKEFCDSKGIKLVAYSPLGAPPVDKEMAEKRGGQIPSLVAGGNKRVVKVAEQVKQRTGQDVSEGQVVLSWGVNRGTVVIPKSATPKRIKENITLLELTEDEVAEIDGIHKEKGMHRSLLHFYATTPGCIFGWSHEQLGWNLDENGFAKL